MPVTLIFHFKINMILRNVFFWGRDSLNLLCCCSQAWALDPPASGSQSVGDTYASLHPIHLFSFFTSNTEGAGSPSECAYPPLQVAVCHIQAVPSPILLSIRLPSARSAWHSWIHSEPTHTYIPGFILIQLDLLKCIHFDFCIFVTFSTNPYWVKIVAHGWARTQQLIHHHQKVTRQQPISPAFKSVSSAPYMLQSKLTISADPRSHLLSTSPYTDSSPAPPVI